MNAERDDQLNVPVVEAEGSSYEMGRQIGEQVREMAGKMIESEKSEIAHESDIEWDKLLKKSEKYLAYTNEKLPWVVRELKGYARGAGINFKDLFLLFCLEAKISKKGCTDIVVCPSVTEKKNLLLAHNNDVGPGLGSQLCLVKGDPAGAPSFLAVAFAGIYINAGINSAGLGFGGNELTPNDVRPGIPQALVFRSMYRARTVAQAFAYANVKERATSYNNIVGDEFGNAYSIEGSATDFEILAPENGYLVHTNHFISPRMQKYETDPQTDWDRMVGYSCSVARYHRARRLVAAREGKKINAEFLRRILSDHGSRPHSICRHPRDRDSGTGDVRTVFSTMIDPAEQEMLFCPTNPCSGQYERFTL